jgi:protein TonB
MRRNNFLTACVLTPDFRTHAMSHLAVPASALLAVPGARARQSPAAANAEGWRFLNREESFAPLAWLVAVTGSFLLVGLAGLIREEGPFTIELGSAGLPAGQELASQETTMAELQAMETVEETAVSEPVEVPLEMPTPIEMSPELADLPELVPALVTEDLFTVPAAPKLETALTPVEAPKVQPKPRPAPAQPTRTARRPTTTAATGGTGGSPGTGMAGAGGGGGRFPSPPYPSFARSRGIQGSVMLTILVNAAGGVESAVVAGSTGYSELDSYASSWVRRNWRFPPGEARSFKLPIVFKLR